MIEAKPNATVNVGDVLIVGAGVTGLLAARTLSARGFAVTLVDRQGLASHQSNHSHGYMHRGHIYQRPDPNMVAALVKGADLWKQELSQRKIAPLNSTATIGFSDRHDAAMAAKSWRSSGLVFSDVQGVSGVSAERLPYCFTTREETYDFTPWYRQIASELTEVKFAKVSATELIRSANHITGVEVNGVGGKFILQSRYVVLAAGAGNLPLVASATRYRGRAINRTSFMLILNAKGLPKLSLVSPENKTCGLFMVSRHVKSSDYWLLSNFVSYADSSTCNEAATLWVRGIARIIQRYTTALHDYAPQWGIYLAPKGELRAVRNTLNLHSVEKYGLDNLCVAAPTKLTLAPLLAELVEQNVIEALHGPSENQSSFAAEFPAERIADCEVSPEMWRTVPLREHDTLVEIIARPGVAASSIDLISGKG